MALELNSVSLPLVHQCKDADNDRVIVVIFVVVVVVDDDDDDDDDDDYNGLFISKCIQWLHQPTSLIVLLSTSPSSITNLQLCLHG